MLLMLAVPVTAAESALPFQNRDPASPLGFWRVMEWQEAFFSSLFIASR
jgi:hypothetical protein